MAEGNVGSLWMSLGIKETVSKELKRIADSMTGVDEKTKKAQENLRKLADTDVSGKDVRFLKKIQEALGSASVEAKELQRVLDVIKNSDKGWKKMTENMDLEKLSRYKQLVFDIENAIYKMDFKNGLSDSGRDLLLSLQQGRAALEGILELRREIAEASIPGMGNPRYIQELQRIKNEGAALLSAPIKNWERLGVWNENNMAWADEAYLKLCTGASEASKKVDAASESLKKEEEQTKKSAEASKENAEAMKKEGEAAKKAAESLEKKADAEKKAAMPNGKDGADGMKKSLGEVRDAAEAAGKEVNKILNTLLGGTASGMTLEDMAKGAARYSAELAGLDATLRKLKDAQSKIEEGKNKSKEDPTKEIREAIKNAQTYIELIQRIYLKQKEISVMGAKQPNVNTKELERGKALLDEFAATLRKVLTEGKGVDGSMIIGNMPKALAATFKEVQTILGTFSRENPLSVFANGADRAWTAISNLETKMRDLQRLMDEGKKMGYKTDMLPENFYELKRRLQELYRLFGDNSHRLTDKAYMGNLFSDIAKTMKIATNAEREYGREKGKTIAVNREEAVVEKAVNQEIANEHKAAQQERERDLKALSDYTKRYMELQEAKRKADERAAKDAKDKARRQSEAEQRRIASETAKMSRLYASMGLGIGKGERVGMRGLELGVNTSVLDKALGEAAELKRKIEEANVALMGKGGRPAYEWYAAQVNRLKESLANATAAQKELNAAQEKANRKAASDDAKRRAEEKRKEAQASRELARAEKQRQSEISATERRYDSLGNKVRALRSVFSRGVALGADVSKAEAEIHRLIGIMRYLMTLRGELMSGNTRALGRLGNTGAGHDTTLAGRVLQDQRAINAAQEKTNREKEKSIDLERAHQQEVARTAAKVRGDLAKAFEQAKNQANGMNSTMQDLKSLFMQGGIVFGAQQFLMSVIQTGGELEKQHIALQSILGDMQNANTMFGQVKELALNSPFTFSELNKDVKQLAAYGVEYDELYDTTKRLADMASGLGVSFERIALAFGQVRSRGWLDGKELRQISYAGIPLLEKLSEYYSKREGRKVSTSEIKTRISGRGVDFEDVKNVFWEMTNAGGQFYNMQQVLSETLLGRYNKLKDAWEIMLSDFASGNNVVGQGLKGTLNLVTELVQALHTMAPVVAAAFSGFALKRLQTMLGGGIGTALLSGKASMAADIQQRVLMGEKVSAQELRILRTKKQITIEDLRALAAAKALSKAELDRMLITKSITPEIYRQAMAETGLAASTWTLRGAWSGTLGMVKAIPGKIRAMAASTATWFAGLRSGAMSVGASFAGMWTSFRLRGAAAISVITAGAKTLGATLWTAIGGLPGLLITGATMGLGYWYSKNEELKNSMKQTADELQDRYKQLNDFLKENDASKTIAEGDSKAIDNMIDEYKEKIKQIAPYNYTNLVMKAEERESHKERLKYLADELRLLQQSNKMSQEKLSDNGMYKELKDALMRSSETFDSIDKAAAGLMAGGEDKATARKKAFGMSLDVNAAAENLKKEIGNIFGDISKDRATLEAAKLSMSNLFAQMGIPEERANEIRASVLQAFGVTDGWLESQVGSEVRQMIDNVAPEIAMKIRSGQKLNEAETKKVKELMDDAKRNLTLKYPEFETTLQRLLAASRFTAVIDLVVNDAGKYGDVQGTMAKRMPKFSLAEKSKRDQYMNYVSTWGKQDSWYEARNSAKSEIDRLKNEYDAAKKSKSSEERLNWLKYQYDNAVGAALDLLNYDYKGEDKKSNKVPKGKGEKKDEALEKLRRELEDFKAARQAYQKLRREAGMNKQRAKNEVVGIYKDLDWGKIDLDNYLGSLERLKAGFDFGASEERRKFGTQLDKEKFEWKFSEEMKPEWERVAANFKEALEKGVRMADLEKELYEKTGNKKLAELAWKDGAVWDEQTRKMAEEFKKRTGADVDLGMTEADAQKFFENDKNAYVLWQKITGLVKDKYVKSLQEAADIMAQTATEEEKVAAIWAKYEDKIVRAMEKKDYGLASRYARQRDKEVGAVRSEGFKQSEDYLMFYGAISQLGMERASEIATQIREQINKSLADGAIDAREYGKEIQQLDEQLEKMASGKKSLWKGGLKGVADQKVQDAYEKITEGAIKQATGRKMVEEGLAGGDWDKVVKGGKLIEAGKKMVKDGEEAAKSANKFKKSLEQVAQVADFIDNIVQGVKGAFDDVKETAAALGADTESDGWQDATAFMDSLSGISSSVKGIVNGAENGDIGGVIKGAVGIFTSPIKAFAAAHDAKLDRQIKLAEREITELERMREYVASILEKTLGGVYSYEMDATTRKTLEKVAKSYEDGMEGINGSIANVLGKKSGSQYSDETYEAAKDALSDPTNAYKAEYASLMAQRDEMQKKRNAEADKKKKDKDKIADYDEELKQMDLTIKQLSADFLKDVYGVDMKSWASQLTDAVVGAWEKGEDAIDAYRKKAKEMVKDLTKNILSQKIMEAAMEKPLEYLTGIIEEKGKLDETDMPKLIDGLMKAGEDATYNITKILDGLKAQGYDFTESGSGSVSSSVKTVTEETADILASYVNAIRLDCSMIRKMQGTYLPEMSETSKAQLTQLAMISENTLRTARASEEMRETVRALGDNVERVINGTKKFHVR